MLKPRSGFDFRRVNCRFTCMKVFAFFIASIFVFQTTVPALCMDTCILEAVEQSACCAIEESDDCCMDEAVTCSFIEEQSCCAAEEMSSCTISKEDGVTNENHSTLPCKSCNIPCCSAPLCCFYFQEITDIDLSVEPVLLTGQLASSNGIPHQGFRGDCFQPPEVV